MSGSAGEARERGGARSISVCVPVYKSHGSPNIATLAACVPAALGDRTGELVVALNGVGVEQAGVPDGAVVVDMGVNRGVAPGWNAAAHAARGDVLVFANDDVILGAGALAQLARTLEEHPDAGVVGPVGATWDLSGPRALDSIDLDGRSPGEVRRVDGIDGFLLATRREVFESVGGFDERYAPCICEEVDFCQAVRALDLECYVVAGVEHEHEFQISKARPWRVVSHNGRREMLWRIHRRNARLFRSKWAGGAT